MAALSDLFVKESDVWRHITIPPYVANRFIQFLGHDILYWGKLNLDGSVSMTDPNGKFMTPDGTKYSLVHGELIKVVKIEERELLKEIPPPGSIERQVTGGFMCNVYEDGTLRCNRSQDKVEGLRVCGVFYGTPGKVVNGPQYPGGWDRTYLGNSMSGEIILEGGYMYYLHDGVIGPYAI
jgi:hypothetical protein